MKIISLKNATRTTVFLLLGLFIVLTQVSCKKDSTANNGTMRVRLTDAPGDYQAVYIDVQGVEITGANGKQNISMVRTGIYNILDFRNGIDTLLGEASLPVGNVSQIRLILGTNNSVMVDGSSYPLSTPSAQQSGLKLNLNTVIVAGITYDVWVDFDASRSIVKQGNGDYSLKPVLHAFSRPLTGAITGIISPFGSASTMMAIQNTDTIGGMVANASGLFYIGGLNPGTYKMVFNANVGFFNKEVSGVVVTSGNVTNMGNVIIL